jgi:hypothetical protein
MTPVGPGIEAETAIATDVPATSPKAKTETKPKTRFNILIPPFYVSGAQ